MQRPHLLTGMRTRWLCLLHGTSWRPGAHMHYRHPPHQVLHGELTEAPLETLSAVAQSVFLPLLSSAHNQEGWPDVVAREVTENLHKFVANGERVAAQQQQGRTGGWCLRQHWAVTAKALAAAARGAPRAS